MLLWIMCTIFFAVCAARNFMAGDVLWAKGFSVATAFCFGMILARRPEYKGLAQSQQPEEKLTEFGTEKKDFLGEIYEKAGNDYFALEEERRLIKDPVMQAQLEKLSHLGRYILKYMRKNPQKIQQARKFVYYYQDRALKLTQEFHQLEEVTAIKSVPVEETKANIRTTLQSFDEAYVYEFNKMISDTLMDINAELKVMQDNFAAAGIKDKGISMIEPMAVGISDSDDDTKIEQQKKKLSPIQRWWNRSEYDLHEGHPWTQQVSTAEQYVLTLEEERKKKGYVVLHSTLETQPEGVAAEFIDHIAAPRARLPMPRRNGKLSIPPAFLQDVKRQKRIVAVLAILGGSFGLHKFYLRRIYKALAYVLFSLTGLPAVIGLYEGISYILMSPEEFYEKIYCP